MRADPRLRVQRRIEGYIRLFQASRVKEKLVRDNTTNTSTRPTPLSYLEMTPKQIYNTMHKAPIKTT